MIQIKENIYTKNIKTVIENSITQNKIRNIQKENDKLITNWNIGKEIVKAQNEDKIKYGNSYIKKLSLELTELYGKGYDYSNLRRMKKFYLYFPNWAPVGPNFITWSHLKYIIPIKDSLLLDLLFFNVEMDCYVVIELKVKDLKKEDIGQLQFYLNYIDLEIKKPHHSPTIGILICKKNDKNIEKYLNMDNIKITTYQNK